MNRVLLIGLAWLSISALAGVLIGRAIHLAGLRDERRARRSRSRQALAMSAAAPPRASTQRVTVPAPEAAERSAGDGLRLVPDPLPRRRHHRPTTGRRGAHRSIDGPG